MPLVSSTDQVSGVVYYYNGTVDHGQGNGVLTIANPAETSPLVGVNVTLMNGTTVFIQQIDPSSADTFDYVVDTNSTGLPLDLKETFVPTTLSAGTPQQIRLCLELKNTGNVNITDLVYEKALPPGLTTAWTSYDSGALTVNGSITWTLCSISPGDTMHLAIAFNITPGSGLYFPGANVSFDYLSSLAGAVPNFSGYTNTTFQVQKSHASADTWLVDASIPDDSEFNISLDNVSVYRSDINGSLSMCNIMSSEPNILLGPGDSWNTSLTDYFNQTPVYFLQIAYHIPYALEQVSHISAITEPFTVTVPTASPTATAPPNYPPPYYPYQQNTATPTPQPSPTPQPYTGPDIVFVTPGYNDIIRGNSTELETSVPPSNGTGNVIYYGSPDNITWVKIGESPVSGNTSTLLWNVPRMNGTYYLKAEHYSSQSLSGVAFTQVLIAQQIMPIGTTTLLMSSVNWTMIIAFLAIIALIIFVAVPFIGNEPVVYDTSALFALSSSDKDWLSKLPRHTVRPDEIVFEIGGVEKLKMKTIKDIEGMRRLEKDYGLSAYDAMAIQLAMESHATLYTADADILDICKKLDVKVKPLEKISQKIKN